MAPGPASTAAAAAAAAPPPSIRPGIGGGGGRPAIVMRIGPRHWGLLGLLVVASPAGGPGVHIGGGGGVVVLTPGVEALAPPVPGGPPGLPVVILPGAAPFRARSRVVSVVWLPPVAVAVAVAVAVGGGRVGGGLVGVAWGVGLVVGVFPGPEQVHGEHALCDQVVRGEAAGLEQDAGARAAVGRGGGDVVVARRRRRRGRGRTLGAAPLRVGRAARVARRGRGRGR
jgi:hypothetical protein